MVFYYICTMKPFKFLSNTTYKTFEDLNFYHDGVVNRSFLIFDNGYGASVVIGPHTYGGSDGFYEMAVIDSEGNILYDTPITSDVIGWLTPSEVTDYLKKIQDL